MGNLTDPSIKNIKSKKKSKNEITKYERFAKSIFESVPIGLILADSRGNISVTNPPAEKLFEYENGKMLGVNLDVLISKRFRKKHAKLRKKYMKSPIKRKKGESKKLYAVTKNGKEFPVEIGFSPLIVGKSQMVLVSIQDSSNHKIEHETIKKERDRIVKVLDLNTDGWWDLNLKNTEEEYLSPGFKETLGYKDHELENRSSTVKNLIFPEDYEIAVSKFNELLASDGKNPYYQKLRYKHKNGSTVWVLCKGVALKDKNGNWDRMIGFHFDITKIIELEENLVKTNSKLEKTNKEMEQFVYSVSHDLKAPLVTIGSYIELLEKDFNSGRKKDIKSDINSLKKATNRMKWIIEDLLEFSRIGELKMKFESVQLSDLLNDVIEDFKPQIDQIGVKLNIEKDLPVLNVDPNQMKKVFENLFSNALKYGVSESPEIRVYWNRGNEKVNICVEDNGPGIEPEYHKKIFELFQRLNQDQKGTGLGLAIVFRIINLHNGDIRVESEVGKGTKFWISLPIERLIT